MNVIASHPLDINLFKSLPLFLAMISFRYRFDRIHC